MRNRAFQAVELVKNFSSPVLLPLDVNRVEDLRKLNAMINRHPLREFT